MTNDAMTNDQSKTYTEQWCAILGLHPYWSFVIRCHLSLIGHCVIGHWSFVGRGQS
jgi:hypothetical protein